MNQLKQFVTGLTSKQRFMLLGGAVATAAILALFVNFLGKPDFKPLFTNMEARDAQELANQLAAKKIPYEISPDGKTVSVPADKVDSSRLEVAANGMPHSGRLGFELFDKMSWGATEFDEKVNYQRALEGELERTIATLADVDSARVHLVMATDSVFLDRAREAKASVILKLKNGQLSDETQAAITKLVSGAVDNLRPEGVTVIDADTNRTFAAHKRQLNNGDGDLEKDLTARLTNTLGPVLGADRVRASVNVEYETDTSEESRETYDPQVVVALTSQKAEEQVTGTALGGVPGTSSNVPGGGGPKTGAETRETGQSSKSENNTYAVNKVVRHIMQPAGRIRRISAALLVDDVLEHKTENNKTVDVRRKHTPEELKQIEDLAKAAIGFDTNRGDMVTVQNIAFAASAVADKPAIPSKIDKVRVTLTSWSSVLRYALLLIVFLAVYFLMLRPVKNQWVQAVKQLGTKEKQAELDSAKRNSLEGAILSGDPQRAMNAKRELVDRARTEPVPTSRLIQTWLREGAES